MTKQIPLTQGKVALVDNEWFDKLNRHKWFAQKRGYGYYAARNMRIGNKGIILSMHREILGLKYKDGKIADHKNRITLDNRLSNLRIVSKTVNNRNHDTYRHNTSGHNGVSWDKAHSRWMAYIRVTDKQIYLGLHDDLEDAVEARRQAEIKYWGEEK